MTIAARGVEFAFHPALTVDAGNGTPCSIFANVKFHTILIKGAGTISSGTIVIEESHDIDYTGDWSVIQSVNATDVTSDAVKVVHVEGLIRALRARISVAIGGGGSVGIGYVGY